MDSFVYVSDETYEQFIAADRAALVLAKDDCEYCQAYEQGIRRLQSEGLLDLAVGKIVLTRPGCRQFKRENPWLRGLDFLPYTILFRAGEKVDEFPASNATYLAERAADAGLVAT